MSVLSALNCGDKIPGAPGGTRLHAALVGEAVTLIANQY
jgi:hypothetical protein